MKDVLTSLASLHRPRILIQAARTSAQSYNRTPHLRRHLGPGKPPQNNAQALILLLEIEAEMNNTRLENRACYRVADHVDILAAMMAEARILRASYPQIVR